ncbi:hypothetical protein M8494_00330 [Serratia ureilytica]
MLSRVIARLTRNRRYPPGQPDKPGPPSPTMAALSEGLLRVLTVAPNGTGAPRVGKVSNTRHRRPIKARAHHGAASWDHRLATQRHVDVL